MLDTQVGSKTHVGIAVALSVAAGITAIAGLSFAVFKGGGGPGSNGNGNVNSSVKPPAATALIVNRVTSASVALQYGSSFVPFSYRSGSVNIGSQINATTYQTDRDAKEDGFLTLSIPKADKSVFVPQMVTVAYRLVGDITTATDRYVTLCIGATEATTLYVDRDGSTYTDSALTARTTSEPCTAIVSRALVPMDITGGAFSPEQPLPFNLQWELLRSRTLLSHFYSPSNYGDNLSTPLTTVHEFDPLLIQPSPGGPINTGTFTTPRTILEVVGKNAANQEIRGALCLPELSVTVDGLNGPVTARTVAYFDTNGTPYSDIFLTKALIDTPCSSSTSRAMKFTLIDGGTYSSSSNPEGGMWWQLSRYRGTKLAHFQYDTFYEDRTAPIDLPQANDPLRVEPMAVPIGQGVHTTPEAIFTVVGKNAANARIRVTLCVPELSLSQTDGTGATNSSTPVFFDTQGTPYWDIFLSNRALSKSCADVVQQAFRPDDLSEYVGETEWQWFPAYTGEGSLTLNIRRGRNIFHELYRVQGPEIAEDVGTLTSVFQDPLAIELRATVIEAPSTARVPRSMFTFTASTHNPTQPWLMENPRRVTLCYPESTFEVRHAGVPIVGQTYFYANDGTPYHDIFLTDRAMSTNCADVLARSFAPNDLSNFALGAEGPWLPSEGPNGELPPYLATFRSGAALFSMAYNYSESGDTQQTVSQPSSMPLWVTPVMPADGTNTVRRSVATFTTDVPGQTATLCIPEITRVNDGYKSGLEAMERPMFYASDGKPFRDIFLTDPISCSTDGLPIPVPQL